MTDAAQNRFAEWTLRLARAGLVVVAVGVFVEWMIATSTGMADRDWWAWTAIAGLAQVAAAVAVLATLWFFWQQLKSVCERARKDFELAHTPLLSIAVVRGQAGRTSIPIFRRRASRARLFVTLRLNADGQGPAYNVIVNMFDQSSPQSIRAQPEVIPYFEPRQRNESN